MRKRTNWTVVAIVAALLTAAILLAGTVATARASAAGATSRSASAKVVLNVDRNGTLVKGYTLAQLKAMKAFPGFAGYMGHAAHGPDAVVGVKVTDILRHALGIPVMAVETVDVADVAPVASDSYDQTVTGAQLLDAKTGFPLFDATTGNSVDPTTLTGSIAALLVYKDTDANVMGPSDGPLRFLVTDSKSENAVMSGKLSVSQVNELNVIDSITITLKAKHTTVKVGKTAVFTGVVTNAVTKDTSVKLRVMKGKKFILAKSGHITSKGAFRLTYKVKKAGKRTFMVTYRIGKTLFRSPKVTITVKK
jgi:hypothetical protein